MSTVLNTHAQAVNIYPASDLFLRHRLQIVEEVWELVLREECGQQMVDLLRQLRDLCSPEGQATDDQASSVSSLIEKLSINEAIRAARGFALYFQLINIVEQDYEQKQQLTRYEDSEVGTEEETLPKIIYSSNHQLEDVHLNNAVNADLLIKNWQTKLKDKGTFTELFPKLFKLNVPPAQIQRLIAQLDVRLVFTAHPTEIVRPTIREKQRRVVDLLQKLDSSQSGSGNGTGVYSWETTQIRSQLLEEIRLWWRTDELHQFKPSVLDEVDYALHYFQQVLFEATPQLYERLKYALNSTFSRLEPPNKSFCQFGSWVGSDRDGNPSVTPEITWQTACYQRHMVLEKYIESAKGLIELLSVSLHWSDVLPDLLESLEIEQSQMSEVYDALALRYRQEPYRLKLAY
ncbi:MAG: phosphoenolpyruvate carboxylase, partial [Cyanobacteria bacterium J06628_3]